MCSTIHMQTTVCVCVFEWERVVCECVRPHRTIHHWVELYNVELWTHRKQMNDIIGACFVVADLSCLERDLRWYRDRAKQRLLNNVYTEAAVRRSVLYTQFSHRLHRDNRRISSYFVFLLLRRTLLRTDEQSMFNKHGLVSMNCWFGVYIAWTWRVTRANTSVRVLFL